MSNKELYQATRRHALALAELSAYLYPFGDELAKRNGYKEVTGIEAIHYYLIQKHNWTPQCLRDMPLEDLQLALSEEMKGWTVPENIL